MATVGGLGRLTPTGGVLSRGTPKDVGGIIFGGTGDDGIDGGGAEGVATDGAPGRLMPAGGALDRGMPKVVGRITFGGTGGSGIGGKIGGALAVTLLVSGRELGTLTEGPGAPN
jgi:hypothetical protein